MKKGLYRNLIVTKECNKLKREIARYIRQRDALRKEIAILPEGTLHIKKVGNYLACYREINGKDFSVCKTEEDTQLMARKMQALAEMRELKVVIKSLSVCINEMELFVEKENCRKGHRTLDKLGDVFDCDVFSLNKQEKSLLEHYPFAEDLYPEERIYPTKCGIKVRSKSEVEIANALYENGIKFLYEPEVLIEGKKYVPDFLIIRDGYKVFIWEHFGLLTNTEYRETTRKKIKAYEGAGFSRNTNLICTTEKDIASEANIQTIIEEKFL